MPTNPPVWSEAHRQTLEDIAAKMHVMLDGNSSAADAIRAALAEIDRLTTQFNQLGGVAETLAQAHAALRAECDHARAELQRLRQGQETTPNPDVTAHKLVTDITLLPAPGAGRRWAVGPGFGCFRLEHVGPEDV